jgi:hypothetical protein
MSSGVEGRGTAGVFARADGPVKTFEDVKGRIVAVNVLGSTIDATRRAMAARTNHTAGCDVEVMSDVARMQRNIDDLNRLGILEETIAIKDHVDLSIAGPAAKRL